MTTDYKFKDVARIYVGKPSTCYCGCAGDYANTSHYAARKATKMGAVYCTADDAKVIRRLNKFNKSPEPVDDDGDGIVTKQIGKLNYTVYLMDSPFTK